MPDGAVPPPSGHPPPDPRADEADQERLQHTVDEAVDEAVEQRVGDVRSGTAEAIDAAARAEQAADSADQAADQAAEQVADDDPLIDTAVRRLEARASQEHPFGRPGRPMSARSPFRIAFTGALGVALAYGLVNAVIAVRSMLVLLLTAAFLAIGLNPAVEALQRRRLPRAPSVGIVVAGLLLLFTAFGLAVVPPIVDQVDSFVDQAPEYVQSLQDNDRIAELDERFQLLDRAQEVLDAPEAIGTTVFGGVLGVGKVVFSAFFSTLIVLILTLYFLSSLPTIKANVYRLVPRSRRARVGLLSDEILGRVGGYVAGALTIGGIAGLSTLALLTVLEVEYAVALAMLVAVTALVPLIGATIGATVVTLIALIGSVQAGIICAVFFLLYQQVENYVLYPRIMKRSVDVSPAATVVAVLIGGSLLGVLGALLAIPIAAAVQLVAQEVVAPRQDAM